MVPGETWDPDGDSCVIPVVATDGARLLCRKLMPSNVPLLFSISEILGPGMLVRWTGLEDVAANSCGGTFSEMLGRCWLLTRSLA